MSQRRKAMKFAPARTPERFRARKRPRSSTYHEIVNFPKFRLHDANPMVHSRSGCANSFFDLGTPFESQKPNEQRKNTEKPNEFTDSENFSLEVAPRLKTMFAMKPANHLGVGITLETIALRVMYNKRRNAARQ